MLPSDIGFVQDALDEIDVDEMTIRAIVGILEDNVDDLSGKRPTTPASGSLGGAESAAQLHHHSSLAHQKVVEAMEDMVAGLKGYQANIHRFHKDISFADDTSSSQSALTTGKVQDVTPTVLQSSSCTSSPSIATPSTCQIPSGGDA